MKASLDFAIPAEAVRAMVDAGAIFSVRHRGDGLGMSFTYRVGDESDLDRCRAILVAVKEKPPAFFQAFRAAVQEAARVGKTEGGAETPPSSAASRRGRGAA